VVFAGHACNDGSSVDGSQVVGVRTDTTDTGIAVDPDAMRGILDVRGCSFQRV
jgi:hypothetical protein